MDDDCLRNSISSDLPLLHPDEREHQGSLASGFYFARGTNSSILIPIPSEVPVGEKPNQQLINDEEGNVLPETLETRLPSLREFHWIMPAFDEFIKMTSELDANAVCSAELRQVRVL